MAQPLESPVPATRVCPFCKSSGACGKCDGAGVRETTTRGRFNQRVKQKIECRACEGSGVCQLCQGRGELFG